ncbi:hypothetical protein CVT25_012376 [Psilocybe cyanescens]|uniref:MIF4G domain-containing protein n=1 Tax=Psilocybe cyanescens TaxID=93625 RepID=A0A409XC42_PSICY|nr:hypothetical protein CVT25_012376 [Psilocybe cyanescens]
MHIASPPPMRYPMCGGQELRSISSDYIDKIMTRNEILDDVVDQLLTTAVTQREYTRSIAYVVVLMSNIFRKRNCDENLRKHFLQKFCHSAISEFENYDWKNASEDNYELGSEYSSIDALALSALIGDLISLRLISYNRFKALMGLLICRIEICLHVECVHTLLSHAAARPTPEMASPFLYQCIRTVRRRTNLCIVPRINRFVRVVSAVSRIPTNEIL